MAFPGLAEFLADCLLPDWPLSEGPERSAAAVRAARFAREACALAPFPVRLPMRCGGFVLAVWLLLLRPTLWRGGGRYRRAAKLVEVFESILGPCRAVVRLHRSTLFLAYFGDAVVLRALNAPTNEERQAEFRAKRQDLQVAHGG
jgi:hypothetical protein